MSESFVVGLLAWAVGVLMCIFAWPLAILLDVVGMPPYDEMPTVLTAIGLVLAVWFVGFVFVMRSLDLGETDG